jgi:plasmid replication initiation protein
VDNEKFNKKYCVVKQNNLIEGKIDENLGSLEYKLLIASLSKIKPNNKVLETIEFTISDFCQLFKIQREGMYSYIKIVCDKLLKRTITIEISKNEWKKFCWLYYIDYIHGKIILQFHPRLEPYLLFCQKNNKYTKYLLENIIDMNSKYSIRMYELLKQYQKIKSRTFSISELKELLGIPKTKYKKHDDFRKRILLPSKKEINGLTDIKIDYQEIKQGRKIEQIKYIILTKEYNMSGNVQYNLLPKLKLISILNKKIYDFTGYVFSFRTLNKYHRIILIDLIKKFDNNGFDKVLIKYPNAFFKWHLDDINKNYDVSKIEDF